MAVEIDRAPREVRPAAHPRLVLAVIIAASAASIMSTDLYTPSMPDLPALLDTDPRSVKLTISLNLLAYGLATLVVGPVSDRFGRRPVMLAGLALFTLFSGACAMASNISQLITFRIAQGLSASVEAVVGLAIIRDLFEDAAQVRALAMWGMAIAVAPALAPIIGGYIHVALGWRANFWVVTLTGAVVGLLALRWLGESTTKNPHALRPRALWRAYTDLLGNRVFMTQVTLLGASLGIIFAFITAAPFILIDQFAVPTQHYGFYQAAMVTAYFIGSLFCNRLAERVASQRLLNVGIGLAALGALAIPLAYLAGAISPLSLTAAVSVIALGMGPIFAVAPAVALAAAGERVGAGSALISAGEMLLCAGASSLVTVLHDGTERPFVIASTALLALALWAWFMGSRQSHGESEPSA